MRPKPCGGFGNGLEGKQSWSPQSSHPAPEGRERTVSSRVRAEPPMAEPDRLHFCSPGDAPAAGPAITRELPFAEMLTPNSHTNRLKRRFRLGCRWHTPLPVHLHFIYWLFCKRPDVPSAFQMFTHHSPDTSVIAISLTDLPIHPKLRSTCPASHGLSPGSCSQHRTVHVCGEH